MTAIAGLESLRAKANVQGRTEALDKFRADFALVQRTERAHGWRTEEEYRADIAEAGAAVQANMHDADWMRTTSAHYAEMADAIRRDIARAERIRNEVRADRARKAA